MADDPIFRYLDDKTVVLSLDPAMVAYLEERSAPPDEAADVERRFERIAEGLRGLLGSRLH